MDSSWMWDVGRPVAMFLPYCPKYGDMVKYEGKDAIVLEVEDLEEWKDMFPIRYRVSVIKPKLKEEYLNKWMTKVDDKWMEACDTPQTEENKELREIYDEINKFVKNTINFLGESRQKKISGVNIF